MIGNNMIYYYVVCFCVFAYGSPEENSDIDEIFHQMNAELLELNKINAKCEWEAATKPSKGIFEAKKKFSAIKTKWKEDWCDQLQYYKHQKISTEGKMIYLLCRGPKYLQEEAELLTSILDELVYCHEQSKICRLEETDQLQCYGELELNTLMHESRNESELLWAWSAWRSGLHVEKKLFLQSVSAQNAGARRNHYDDIGQSWREEMEIENLENIANKLYQSIKPLYTHLHAFVRFKLRKIYPQLINPLGPIPAHVLGNLWSQDWSALIDLLVPDSPVHLNVTAMLTNKKWTVIDMIKKSEDFYCSLGFPRLPKKFWTSSNFIRDNTNNHCHAVAFNMYVKNDFRILACLDVNEHDFHVIHHEIGHIQYFMAYQEQPTIFRNGVNSAFHESIGDAVMLGVLTPQHLQRLGLADDQIFTQALPLLLKQALMKIPQITFALSVEKWRWRVFEGLIEPEELNNYWWQLQNTLMGIEPPSARPSANFFDPAAKFHVISNTPYIRYFFASFLEFEIFETMCKVAVTGKINNEELKFPLHKCDIYGSKAAGNKLRKLMAMGSSINSVQALRKLTGYPQYSENALLNFFKPVRTFLEREIKRHNIPVGWTFI